MTGLGRYLPKSISKPMSASASPKQHLPWLGAEHGIFRSRAAEAGSSTDGVCLCYLNEAAVGELGTGQIRFGKVGRLVVTAGNETGFDEIESDVRQLCSRFSVVSAGYGPWQTAQNVPATER